jgi:hypothetical protein
VLGCGLCVVFGLLWLAVWRNVPGHGRRVLLIAALMMLAAGLQATVHGVLYGRPSVFGRPPPFLMARLLGDGPARKYLQEHCASSPWVICSFTGSFASATLPNNDAEFLWAPHGVWQTASMAQREQLRKEQMPLLLATLRTYPLQQMQRSGENFVHLLVTMGPDDFWNYDTFTHNNLEYAAVGLSGRYLATRQAHNDLPQRLAMHIQLPTIAASVCVIAALLPWAWRRRQWNLIGLAAVVLFILPANAFLGGVVSCVAPRYQGRIAWLAMLLAGLMIAAWSTRNESDEA